MQEITGSKNDISSAQQWKTRTDALIAVMSIREERKHLLNESKYYGSLWAKGRFSDEAYENAMAPVNSMVSFYDECEKKQFEIADAPRKRGISDVGSKAVRLVMRPFLRR